MGPGKHGNEPLRVASDQSFKSEPFKSEPLQGCKLTDKGCGEGCKLSSPTNLLPNPTTPTKLLFTVPEP